MIVKMVYILENVRQHWYPIAEMQKIIYADNYNDVAVCSNSEDKPHATELSKLFMLQVFCLLPTYN